MINDYEATSSMTSDSINNGSENFTNSDIVSTLNELIETCKDGQEGFKQAAEGVERSDLKSLFFEFSQQRAHFAGELQSIVQQLGEEPEKSGSTAGALHRGWINIKSAVTGKNDASIIAEAERGEDIAKNAYAEAIKTALPPSVSAIISRQAVKVREAHDRVRSMERAVTAH